MIKIALQQLLDANVALMELGEEKGLPPRTAYRIARVIRKTRDEVKGWNDQRLKIMRESGKSEQHPQVPGEIWIDPKKVNAEELAALNHAMEDLGSVEIEVNADTMKLADFGDKVGLKPSWLAALDWLIVE